MKETARFEILSSEMRGRLCAILSDNGYPSKSIRIVDANENVIQAFVVVYEKEDK